VVVPGDGAGTARAFGCSTIARNQGDVRAGLVNEDVVTGIELGHDAVPDGTARLVPLGGTQCPFFLALGLGPALEVYGTDHPTPPRVHRPALFCPAPCC